MEIQQPMEPTESMEIQQPMEPTESMEIQQPMEPTESMEIQQPMEPTESMEIPQSMETTHFMKMPKSSDTGLLATSPDSTMTVPAVSDSNHRAESSDQELSDKAMIIDEGLQNSISQNQEIGVVLDLLSSELIEMEQKEGIEPLRARMKELVHKLKSSQGDMVGQLQTTIDYLNSTVGDRDKLDEELRRVRRLSMTDELTGLPNRRAFMARLENEIGRVKRHRESLSLILLDLDYFKKVNDTYGHAVGDQVLKCYANEVFSLFRQYDMVARYGGEEFAVLSPNTDMDGALCALSKAMDRVKKLRFEHDGTYITVPTFSAGVAVYRDGEQVEAFLQRADQALYQAKSHGRNRIEVAAG
jgi:diguanylate cyclase (GGDEF)-like protein